MATLSIYTYNDIWYARYVCRYVYECVHYFLYEHQTHRGMYYSPVIISANNSEAIASSLSTPSAACVVET